MRNMNEITIKKLLSMLKNKELSVKELVQEYMERMRTLDTGTEGLNSILELNPDALELAGQLDLQHSERKSLLFGVPVLLKDNIDTADKMHTSAGSLALAELIAAADAEIVKILRGKGALILGKTNMTEFANYMTAGMPPGYSSRGGQVLSPYQKDKNPSGSSTGSAVAVTANLCCASLGSDTAGSIISPAVTNSIVGFRPSKGMFSQKGLLPISFTCDTVGPMTRTVEDSIILFSELTGITVNTESSHNGSGITAAINEWELKNMNGEEQKKSQTIIQEVEKAGITVKRLNLEPLAKDKIKTIQKYEFKHAMNRYLSGQHKEFPIKSLKDIIEFNDRHKEEALRYGQTLLIDAQNNTRGDLTETEYIELLKEREQKKIQVYEMLRGIDAFIMFQENLLLQYIGMPIITIPHGLYNDGMPYGFYLTALTDAELLKYAYYIEQIAGFRVPPKI